MTPRYVATAGAAWLEDGGCYVEANIRGGGEFGPTWHQAAKKAERCKAYEDFEAVARDLVARGITSHDKLGCQGGSNGGLLTGEQLSSLNHPGTNSNPSPSPPPPLPLALARARARAPIRQEHLPQSGNMLARSPLP